MATAAQAAGFEQHDGRAFAGSFLASGALAIAEAGDRADIQDPTIVGPLAAAEAGDGAGLAGANSRHYEVYSNGGTGGPIDYSRPVAPTLNTSWITPPLTPGTWSFGVRAAGPAGLEQNLDCVTTIVIDADGNDATHLPAPPIGLTAHPAAGAQLVAHWTYPPVAAGDPKAPQGFRLYLGSPGPDYTRPAATIAASSAVQGVYWTRLTGLTDGTTYRLAVRAFNGSGEEANTTTVTVTAKGTGPQPVTGLTALAVV